MSQPNSLAPDTSTKHTDIPISDNEKITTLVDLIYKDIFDKGGRFKIMELLKALEFKRKIAPPDDREGAFWNMIDELRHEKQTPNNQQEPTNITPLASKSDTQTGKKLSRNRKGRNRKAL